MTSILISLTLAIVSLRLSQCLNPAENLSSASLKSDRGVIRRLRVLLNRLESKERTLFDYIPRISGDNAFTESDYAEYLKEVMERVPPALERVKIDTQPYSAGGDGMEQQMLEKKSFWQNLGGGPLSIETKFGSRGGGGDSSSLTGKKPMRYGK